MKPKVKAPKNNDTLFILNKYNLNSICYSSKCPNINECFNRGVATFMIYFIFKVNNPPLFFKKLIKILKNFFSPYSQIKYDYKKAGFYIENRKICSLGFSYKKGYSKHGVSIHLNNDLKNFNSVTPCNLKGIIATSLYKENILIDKNNIKIRLTNLIKEEFNETENQSTTK